VGQGLDFIGARFDGGGFAVGLGVRVMGLHQAGVIEEKLVPARRAELAFLEKHAYLRRGAIDVVGVNLDDDRHLVRSVTLKDDVFDHEFFRADARALFDGAVDGLAVDTLLFRLFDGGKKAGFMPGSGPPILAATEISRTSLAVARPFLRPATNRLAWSHCRPMPAGYQIELGGGSAALRPCVLATLR
jgi:hypothetical protein